MSSLSLPDLHELRFHPELSALAALVLAVEIARRALAVAAPDDPDPLSPQLYAADIVLRVSRHRERTKRGIVSAQNAAS